MSSSAPAFHRPSRLAGPALGHVSQPTEPPHLCLHVQGKYILTPSPITYGEEQLLHFLGQLLGIAIRADVPLPLDLLPSFWKTLVGEPLDPDQDLQEADILTYNYVKKFESVSEKHVYPGRQQGPEQCPGPPLLPPQLKTGGISQGALGTLPSLAASLPSLATAAAAAVT